MVFKTNFKDIMKTVEIQRNTREKIRKYSKENESVDKTINRLLDESEIPLKKEYKRKKETHTNIRISEDTLERLKEFKITSKESHDSTISRLFSDLENKD